MPGLLATKLRCPSIPTRYVQRALLIQRLNEGLELMRQITLVSAPAGFGKTTCITEWVNSLENWLVSWLSLDLADDDPGRFFVYFITALQKMNMHLGDEIIRFIRSGQLPPAEVISTTLVNDMVESENRCLLVLDDFHVIQDRFILEVLEQLVNNLPPSLHLVLLTREDPPLPLARLRANNLLTEIRARDLRFSNPDATIFFDHVMGIPLSDADITQLGNKTEGWVVGLQLAGLSIRDRRDPSAFIANLSGSHRFILGYLTEQVLNRQPQEIQQFLLQTAILDKLNGDLCNAVTGRSDSYSLLEQLYNANLFLIPLDDEQHWYRYHHLFVDLLRNLQNAFTKQQLRDLHRRAGYWYAQAAKGKESHLANEAIHHALIAEDYAMVVNLLEKHARQMIMQGYAKTVNLWVQAIPSEWSTQSPKTNLAFIWMHLLRGAYDQVLPYLEKSRSALESTKHDPDLKEEQSSLQAEWLALQSLMLYMQEKPAESKSMALKALEIAPQQDNHVRSLAYYALGSIYLLLEDKTQAMEAYQMAIQCGRISENIFAELMSTVSLAEIAFESSQLHLAFETTAPIVARLKHSASLPPLSALLFGLLGEINIQWNRIDQAKGHILHALQLSTLGGFNTAKIFCHVLLSRLSLIEGDTELAFDELQKALDLMLAEMPEYIRQEVISYQVRVYLTRNQSAITEMTLQDHGFTFEGQFTYPPLFDNQRFSHSQGLLYNSSLRVLLFRAYCKHELNDVNTGITLANRIINEALQNNFLIVALEALLLRAQLHTLLDDSTSNQSASRADYIHALKIAHADGIIGVFLEQGSTIVESLSTLVKQNDLSPELIDFAKQILGAFLEQKSSSRMSEERDISKEMPASEKAALIEPLTDRELDVLRLMAEGLKYQEIADSLFISLNTVRFHVKTIYNKLNVNNRTQAIQIARRLEIM